MARGIGRRFCAPEGADLTEKTTNELIVYVGLTLYLSGKQRAEIREELHEANRIELSDGSVSNLCERFLHYLEALHLARVPLCYQLLQEEGYPLHLDAGCERGKVVHLI